ncbi:M55 family metallopeptidase [Brucella anthropi]|uniref:M55 family metallopeptidase n=1 Tax=Brucella anthropi TaxID=529 RepID=A0A6L3Z1K1_BRUAN|nr:M55 family metallopeptidase [Brucella anthropi]KAB2765639.1 M55 family metallopeptidase [Brucella anthropi]KAB2774128.1 M55 family metallopeptidase [Brucella anthropi]
MRIYISADIEGVAGVVAPAQGQAGHAEYEKARILMTEEVNAVIEGLVEAGATEILVNDSHGPMTNILPSLLHPAADLLLGKPKPMNMACGLTAEFDLFLMVGHHSMAGKGGVLAHTTNGFAFREVRINNLPYGEPGIYGAYAGELGVPVGLVSGDDCTRDENIGFFPDAEFIVVKQSFGHRAARQISVQRARAMLREGAIRAVREAGSKKAFRQNGPYKTEFLMSNAALADQMAILPPARRVDAVTVGFDCVTMAEVVGWMTALSAMSFALR